jgi:hypothetical protein
VKSLIALIFIILFAPAFVLSQTYSEITYESGTQIEVQSGADVCATNIIVNGSFSGGGTFCTGPLPVTISEFTSITLKNDVKLYWKTEMEMNNSGFDIERKSKGELNWKKIGFVQGFGTTNEPKTYTYEDKKIQTGTYCYRLKQVDYNGSFEYFQLQQEVTIAKPGEFSISQNYPNPSNPKSIIEFQLPEKSHINISVYNLLGQLVKELVNGVREAGIYSVEFDGSSLASGTYLYRMVSENYTSVKKLILVK